MEESPGRRIDSSADSQQETSNGRRFRALGPLDTATETGETAVYTEPLHALSLNGGPYVYCICKPSLLFGVFTICLV